MNDHQHATTQRDVVVVGGGAVGLTLALGLARAGLDVLVLEKGESTVEHSRAPAIWPRTQEIFAEIDMLDQLAAQGILVPHAEIWDADRDEALLSVPIEELAGETRYARLLILPQSKTEHLLCAALQERGQGHIRFASEATGFAQTSFGVDVRYRCKGCEHVVSTRFVAGCDGAHSAVRDHLGGSLEGITYSVKAALADLSVKDADSLAFPRVTMTPRVTIAIRIDHDLWRLIFPYPTRERPAMEQWIEDAAASLFAGHSHDTVWTSDFQLHRRISSHWVNGRIVLAGDAAHLNSPVGGEGMNAGIGDAAMLRKALIDALASDSPQRLVDYVASRRRSVEEGVNAFTDVMTRLLLAGDGRFIRPALSLVRLAMTIGAVRRHVLRRMALLDRS